MQWEAVREFEAQEGYNPIYAFKGCLRLLCSEWIIRGQEWKWGEHPLLGSPKPAVWQLSPRWSHWGWTDLRDVLEVKWTCLPHDQISLLEWQPQKSPCLPVIATWILNTYFKFCPNLDSWPTYSSPTSFFQKSTLTPLRLTAHIQLRIHFAGSIFKIYLEFKYFHHLYCWQPDLSHHHHSLGLLQ